MFALGLWTNKSWNGLFLSHFKNILKNLVTNALIYKQKTKHSNVRLFSSFLIIKLLNRWWGSYRIPYIQLLSLIQNVSDNTKKTSLGLWRAICSNRFQRVVWKLQVRYKDSNSLEKSRAGFMFAYRQNYKPLTDLPIDRH